MASITVATFGEAVITYKEVPADVCVPDTSLLGPAATVQLRAVGGAELNVAVALARIGVESKWCSVLPAGALGDYVANAARAAGVDLSACVRKSPSDPPAENEIGTLHVVDDGSGPRPHYQRLQSAFCKSVDGSLFNFDEIFAGRRWVHLTGITPLLGDGPRAAWSAALNAARSQSVQVFLDLNHRPALGTFDELWSLVTEHMKCVTLLMTSEDSLVRLAKKYSLLPPGTPLLHHREGGCCSRCCSFGGGTTSELQAPGSESHYESDTTEAPPFCTVGYTRLTIVPRGGHSRRDPDRGRPEPAAVSTARGAARATARGHVQAAGQPGRRGRH